MTGHGTHDGVDHDDCEADRRWKQESESTDTGATLQGATQ